MQLLSLLSTWNSRVMQIFWILFFQQFLDIDNGLQKFRDSGTQSKGFSGLTAKEICDEILVKQLGCPKSKPRDLSTQPTLLHNPVHLDISSPLISNNSIAPRTTSWKWIACTSDFDSGSTLHEYVCTKRFASTLGEQVDLPNKKLVVYPNVSNSSFILAEAASQPH